MSFNPLKWKFFCFPNKKHPPTRTYTCCNAILEQVDSITTLSGLNWSESGYTHELTHNSTQEQATQNKAKQTSNITWYNLPFNSNVKTNLCKSFYTSSTDASKKSSTPQDFNRHTHELLMHAKHEIVSSQNKQPPLQQLDTCNCRKKTRVSIR